MSLRVVVLSQATLLVYGRRFEVHTLTLKHSGGSGALPERPGYNAECVSSVVSEAALVHVRKNSQRRRRPEVVGVTTDLQQSVDFHFGE